MQLGLNDKVAIVTGSGRGIGAETARALAEEGARIVVTDIDAQVASDHCAALQRDGFQATLPIDRTPGTEPTAYAGSYGSNSQYSRGGHGLDRSLYNAI